jgi:heavy metal translocating P-type ATPase
MLTSARIFDEYAEARAKKSIASLLKLRPHKTKVLKNDEIVEVSIREVRVGDLVVVGLGETISVDGTIEDGEATINQSSLTGESLPVSKKKGDKALSATIVVSGRLFVRTEKVGKDTTLERIIDLVENSRESKADIDTLAEKFTAWYIALVFLGAIAIYLITKDLTLVLSVALVVCADDIAVSVPLAFLMSIGYAAKKGIIVKGSDFLEGLRRAKVIVVDKTGTLTKGNLNVEFFEIYNGMSQEDFLYFSGTASMLSEHPVSKAIWHYAKTFGLRFYEPGSFLEWSGKGLEAVCRQKKVIIGKLSFVKERGVQITADEEKKIADKKEEGMSVSVVSVDGKMAGFFALADELKPNIKNSIIDLKSLGIEKIVMLTGDNEKIAKRITAITGIDEFHANLLPEDKLKYLKKYLSKKYTTVMIGDGVNDAATLGLADIGVAMGAIGSDAAIESADVVLMKDDFSKIPELIRLSKFTFKIIKQDFMIWGITNAVGLGLVFGGIIGPTGAAAFNFLTDFLPLMNSGRIFGLYLKGEKVKEQKI